VLFLKGANTVIQDDCARVGGIFGVARHEETSGFVSNNFVLGARLLLLTLPCGATIRRLALCVLVPETQHFSTMRHTD